MGPRDHCARGGVEVRKCRKQDCAHLHMIATRVERWLDRLAENAEHNAKIETRFLSLRDAYVADAKNYRGVASDLRKALGR